jgi:hypothetical protein
MDFISTPSAERLFVQRLTGEPIGNRQSLRQEIPAVRQELDMLEVQCAEV